MILWATFPLPPNHIKGDFDIRYPPFNIIELVLSSHYKLKSSTALSIRSWLIPIYRSVIDG